tara:strand:+ start:4232 stop:5329 length:1098 start_codon:yes stop_codon:yes gene_type:complete
MSKKIIALIAIGGTGGHVFPGYNLAMHLLESNYTVELISDKRGYKYLGKNNNFKTFVMPSSPIKNENVISKFFSFFFIFYSILRSLIFLIFKRPKIIFGMGGYASFPICVAAYILRIKFIIYENNLIIGKANKYLLPFCEKIFVSIKELDGVPEKYNDKIIEIGNIIKKEIIELSKKKIENETINRINILVLGGSQAAKAFAEILPVIFKKCSSLGVPLKIYQHCLPTQNNDLQLFYKSNNIEFEIFNFTNNLIYYFSKVNFAITRSGSSILAELSNSNIPFVSIPLPSSADNHQLKNAIYYKSKNFGLLIEEKDLNEKLLYLIKEIYEDDTKLDQLKKNLNQYSDKNVYENIIQELEKIINEKN